MPKMYTSVQNRMAMAYKRVDATSSVDGADPHQLIQLLFNALTQSLAAAHGAMERGDLAAKGQAIGRAVRLLEEGLKAGLNTHTGQDSGDKLALQLRDLYDYAIMRLTYANLKNDIGMVREVRGLVDSIASSWQQIRPATGS
jgi:flagellar secretion chaperone FliS